MNRFTTRAMVALGGLCLLASPSQACISPNVCISNWLFYVPLGGSTTIRADESSGSYINDWTWSWSGQGITGQGSYYSYGYHPYSTRTLSFSVAGDYQIWAQAKNTYNLTDSDYARVYVVEVSSVKEAGTQATSIWVPVQGTASLQAQPYPSVSWPSGKPTWSIVSQPSGTSATVTPGSNGSATLNGTSAPGLYRAKAICGSSDDGATIDVTAIDVQIDTSFPATMALGGTQSLACTPLGATGGTFSWSKASGPGTVTFSPSATAEDPTFSASAAGTYTVQVQYTKNGATASKTSGTITVSTVSVSITTPSSFPGYVGADNALQLDCTPSGITGGTYSWSKASGPGTVSFSNATAKNPTFSATVAGDYVVQVQYTTHGITASAASGTITVVGVGVTTPSAFPAYTPSATALQLDCTPTVSGGTYSWSKVSGPGTVNFSSTTAKNPTFTASTVGDYVVRVQYTVNGVTVSGTSGTITVFNISITTPTSFPAFVGTGNNLQLDCTPSSATGGTYSWSKVSGPGTVTFSNATIKNPTFSATEPGAYTVRVQYTVGGAPPAILPAPLASLESISPPLRASRHMSEPVRRFHWRPCPWASAGEASVGPSCLSLPPPRRSDVIEAAAVEEIQVTVLEATNSLLINATQEQHAHIATVLRHVDVVQQDLRTFKVYDIKHIDAKEVRKQLSEFELVGGKDKGSTPVAGTPERITAAAAANSATKDEQANMQEPQVSVIESTNSLLVNATEFQHARIASVINHVDVVARNEAIPYEIYALENQEPEHLAEVLQKILQEKVQDKEAKTEKVVRRTEEEIVIVPDKNTFSLVVYASMKNQEWISKLIKTLDKRRPQVLIDATLVEITKTDAFTYDLNLLGGSPTVGSTSSITKADPNVLGKVVQSNKGVFTAFYGDEHIQTLLQAMQSKDYGRVLAKPKILVNDNEAGKITTKDVIYVETSSSIPVTSGTAGPQTNFVQTAVRFEPYEAGITLDITPHISEGNLLRLDIALTRSDFLETADPKKPPNTRSNEVTTKVTVPDGSTIILGGLLKLNQNKGGQKVPILGDAPLVGGLFRSINNKDTQNKLYVFVKAEIIRPDETAGNGYGDLRRTSEQNRDAFEKHEQEFQTYQSWPGIKAKPMQPAKVLEAN
jgi:type II secretory pathway component GspD/PulD (secretin)